MKTKSVEKGKPQPAEKKTKGEPRRGGKKAKRPPVTFRIQDACRHGEALTISEAREAAAALAERLKVRYSALMDPPKKRQDR